MPDASPPGRKKPVGRKEEILEVAKDLFFRQGFRRTTLEDIAGEVGLVKSAVYKYFHNKDDLFRAIIADVEETFMDVARQAADTRESLEKRVSNALLAVFGWECRIVYDYGPRPRVWHELRPHFLNHRMEGAFERLEIFVRECLEEGLSKGELNADSGDIEPVSRMLIWSMHEVFECFIIGLFDEDEGRRYVRTLVRTVFNGLLKRGPKS